MALLFVKLVLLDRDEQKEGTAGWMGGQPDVQRGRLRCHCRARRFGEDDHPVYEVRDAAVTLKGGLCLRGGVQEYLQTFSRIRHVRLDSRI